MCNTNMQVFLGFLDGARLWSNTPPGHVASLLTETAASIMKFWYLVYFAEY